MLDGVRQPLLGQLLRGTSVFMSRDTDTGGDEELQEMVDEADHDGAVEVNEKEFFRIMKKTSLF